MISENSIKALKDYLLSSKVSQWLASSVISNYGYYFIDCYSSDFNETCDYLGLEDRWENIEYLIMCDGELEESVDFCESLRNSKTYHFIVDHVMDLFSDYDAIMELVKTENLQTYYDIKNA